MLNTHKLLYILPDVTYVAELLPGKKEHSFGIQAFRQINGEFLNEEEAFIPGNIEKLFSKIDPESYRLILPDFLFTNTIIEVKETNETKVKQYIRDELLPKLGLFKETHEIAAFILTQYGSVTKIQLTALEKEVLDAIVISAKNHNIKIEHISPLTWTLKSIISLEPSISVVQIGTMLYTAEHYIGVDQCTISPVSEIENVAETIKTLKGAQPSIQTVYLLTNSLVEERLKELVSSTLPIQQLTVSKDEDSQMPSYVKQIVESGMKTLDITDFSVPSFALPKEASGKPLQDRVTEDTDDSSQEAPIVSAVVMSKPQALSVFDDELESTEDESSLKIDPETLPQPTMPSSLAVAGIGTLASVVASTPAEEVLAVLDTEVVTEKSSPETITTTWTEVSSENSFEAETQAKPAVEPFLAEDLVKEDEELSETTAAHWQPAKPQPSGEEDETIAQFASHNNLRPYIEEVELIPRSTVDVESADLETESKPKTVAPAHQPVSKRPVIKNPGNSHFMHMAFVTFVVFALTVAAVGGVGVGIFYLTGRSQTADSTLTATPSPLATSAPVVSIAPSASPSASLSATLNKSTAKILVVNATTKAGYAGTTTKTLQDAGYKQVTARNARGEYDPGTYVLLTTQDKGVIDTLTKDSALTLEFAPGKTAEDPTNQYEAVIVLAK